MRLDRLVASLKASLPSTEPGLLAGVPDSVDGSSELNVATDGRSDCGSIRVGDVEFTYVSCDHWTAIADRIDREEHLRLVESPGDVARVADNGNEAVTRSPRAVLLYGCPPRSRAEILAAMPPKAAVDRYVARYFNRMELVSYCKCLALCSH